MNIRSVRKKIKSVANVKKITGAMEMVSVIKMKKAQTAAVDSRPYQETIDGIIKEVTAKVDISTSPLLKNPAPGIKRELSIVVSTNKGLCGAYNFNLFRFVIKNAVLENNDFIVIGKKGALFLNKVGATVTADFSLGQTALNDVSAIFKLAVEGFLKNQYSRVNIFYNKFISILANEPVKEVILPVTYKVESEENIKAEVKKEFVIEPSPQELIDQLLRSYVEEKIRNCLIQGEAGEHSSRMIAMKNATENAENVIYNLTLLRNQIRQEKITYELLDMLTAKESVD